MPWISVRFYEMGDTWTCTCSMQTSLWFSTAGTVFSFVPGEWNNTVLHIILIIIYDTNRSLYIWPSCIMLLKNSQLTQIQFEAYCYLMVWYDVTEFPNLRKNNSSFYFWVYPELHVQTFGWVQEPCFGLHVSGHSATKINQKS